MAAECLPTVIVTPHFLRSACELPEEQSRDLVETLKLLMEDPGDASLHREPLGGEADGIHSIRAGASSRILISGVRDVKLLFVGSDDAAHRFAEHMCADATAFAEAPIAFQLRIDFWQAEAVRRFESPSCGAPVSAGDLAGLILHGRRYLPLANLLLSRGPETGTVELTFREIETALAEALPEPARTSPGWWANDRSHIQAHSWLAIGWQTTAPHLQEETVTFVRKPQGGD